MKKFVILLVAVLASLFVLSSCVAAPVAEVQKEGVDTDENPSSMFVIVEKADNWDIVYHKDTKVMYAVSDGGYNCGNFTVLLDEYGYPMLYGEEYGD